VNRADADDTPDHRADQVRRMLRGAHPPVPADLALRAAERGARLLRRRRVAHRLVVCLLWAVVAALVVWAVVAEPWTTPPASTTSPDGW
jgi:ferric-dicitrate binding protein FerR (iron transport regulator)